MLDRGLYKRVPASEAKGKKVRSMWLDEERMEDGEPPVRSRCVAMEFNQYDRLDTYTATPIGYTVTLTCHTFMAR